MCTSCGKILRQDATKQMAVEVKSNYLVATFLIGKRSASFSIQ